MASRPQETATVMAAFFGSVSTRALHRTEPREDATIGGTTGRSHVAFCFSIECLWWAILMCACERDNRRGYGSIAHITYGKRMHEAMESTTSSHHIPHKTIVNTGISRCSESERLALIMVARLIYSDKGGEDFGRAFVWSTTYWKACQKQTLHRVHKHAMPQPRKHDITGSRCCKEQHEQSSVDNTKGQCDGIANAFSAVRQIADQDSNDASAYLTC